MARMSLKLTQMDTGVVYLHHSDERVFFEWLKSIPCVSSVVWGEGADDGLVVRLKRRPGKDDLRQLIALCYRYGVNMRQLARFETPQNRDWLRKPGTYWYRGIFGDGRIGSPIVRRRKVGAGKPRRS